MAKFSLLHAVKRFNWMINDESTLLIHNQLPIPPPTHTHAQSTPHKRMLCCGWVCSRVKANQPVGYPVLQKENFFIVFFVLHTCKGRKMEQICYQYEHHHTWQHCYHHSIRGCFVFVSLSTSRQMLHFSYLSPPFFRATLSFIVAMCVWGSIFDGVVGFALLDFFKTRRAQQNGRVHTPVIVVLSHSGAKLFSLIFSFFFLSC